jgi:predicted O-methyltransferase YrrM
LGAELHEVTSDEYFSTGERESFDCVLVDGLHTFEQTLRDVVNAMEALEPGGAIIIDDTIPIDEYSAMRSQSDALAERKRAGRAGQFWQ